MFFVPTSRSLRLGKRLIGPVGIVLIFASSMAAAYAPVDSLFGIVSGRTSEQTIYIIECGILVSIFPFSTYFDLSWDRLTVGNCSRVRYFGMRAPRCMGCAR